MKHIFFSDNGREIFLALISGLNQHHIGITGKSILEGGCNISPKNYMEISKDDAFSKGLSR